MYYYVDSNRQRKGPFKKEDLIREISPNTLVWTDGMPEWTPANQVDDLKDYFTTNVDLSPVETNNSQKKIIWICIAIIGILVAVIAVLALQKNNNSSSASTEVVVNSETEAENENSDSDFNSAYEVASGVNDDRAAIENAIETLEMWNKFSNEHDAEGAAAMYTDNALYFQSYYSRSEIKKSHSKFFGKNPEAHQRVDNLMVVWCDDYQVKITYDKHECLSPGAEEKTYQCYMTFANTGGKMYINEESDELSDRNIAKHRRGQNVKISLHTTPREVFVGNQFKSIDTSYWDIVGFDLGDTSEPPAGSFADQLSSICETLKMHVHGEIKMNYKGKPNTYYVSATDWASGEDGTEQFNMTVVYDASTDKMTLE